MNSKIIVKYMGFKPTSLAREYTFQVSEDGADREFTLNISNDAFVSHRARYQDAPAICSERLQLETMRSRLRNYRTTWNGGIQKSDEVRLDGKRRRKIFRRTQGASCVPLDPRTTDSSILIAQPDRNACRSTG